MKQWIAISMLAAFASAAAAQIIDRTAPIADKQKEVQAVTQQQATSSVNTQKTAAEVAFELGYATPQHFNNAFKKRFGVTPNLVRNNP